MSPVLGYWKLRGLAQPIRLLLNYVGEEYEEKHYEFGQAPDYSPEDWLMEKFNLGLKFPNIPYYTDGDFKLSESTAIFKYLGMKYKMAGRSDREIAEIEMVLGACGQYRLHAYMTFYNPDFDNVKYDLIKSSYEHHQLLDDFGKGKLWFMGNEVTIVDIFVYEYMMIMKAVDENILDHFPWLNHFVARFQALHPFIRSNFRTKKKACIELVQPIRLLLQYVGEEYEDKLYEFGPGPDYSKEDWLKEKLTLDLPFPNIPYYTDGDFTLSESTAIFKYLGVKYNMAGTTAQEMAKVDMVLAACGEYRLYAYLTFLKPEFDKLKSHLLRYTYDKYRLLDDFGKGKLWFMGNHLTIVDFFIYEYLMILNALDENILNQFMWLNHFVARFQGLPAIRKFLRSEKFIPHPFLGAMAFWGGE